MSLPLISQVCAVGDVSDPRAWSGIPYHFWLAARERWGEVDAFRTNLNRHYWPRRLWNLGRVLTGRGRGGYQYGKMFLESLESELSADLSGKHLLSFNQHFPRASTVLARGGKISYYIDAPAAALFEGRGLDIRLPRAIREEAIATEAENYRLAEKVFVMARWAKDDLLTRWPELACKIHVVLPGANIVSDFRPQVRPIDAARPFTLGIVGMDWKRKGLPLLVEVARRLRKSGVNAEIMAIGGCPDEYARLEFVRYEGKIDKRTEAERFLKLIGACDLGCLFSESEALGISVLEFLRCGVPVSGFLHEGMLDTLPPDAGLRFRRDASVDEITSRIAAFANAPSERNAAVDKACQYASMVTWSRCVNEMDEYLQTGDCASALRLA